MTETRNEYTQCPRKAEWQLCDECPPDGEAFACIEHVSALISETTTLIVPYDGVEECLYCYDTPHDLGAIKARLEAATELPFCFEAWQIFHGHASADLCTLVNEIERLRMLLGRNRQGAEDDAIRLQDANHQAQTEIERLRLQISQLTESLEEPTS